MTVPLALQVIWTKTTGASITTGAALQAEVITAITAEGWTLVSGSTYQSPVNSKNQQIRLLFANSGTAFEVTVQSSTGVAWASREMVVDGAGTVHDIWASAYGVHINPTNGTEIGRKLWAFMSDLRGEPQTLSNEIYGFINGPRRASDSALDGSWNSTVSFRSLEGGVDTVAARAFPETQTFVGTVVDLRYPAGGRAYIIPVIMAGSTSVLQRYMGGIIPGCYIADDGIADGATVTPRIDVGVNGTFEVMAHTLHSSDTNVKYALRTA